MKKECDCGEEEYYNNLPDLEEVLPKRKHKFIRFVLLFILLAILSIPIVLVVHLITKG